MGLYQDTIISIFEKITVKQAYTLAIIITVLVFTFFITPTVVDYINKSEERKEERYRREIEYKLKYNRRLDSIEEVKNIYQNELFIYKNRRIIDLMSFLEKRFPTANHISVVSVHNGGGVPKTGSESKMTLLYTTDNVKGVNMLKDYTNHPLYSGYGELVYQMLSLKGKPFYLRRVEDRPSIYNGQTKENMDFLNTKSIYGMWIKSSSTHTYYLMAAFGEKGLESRENFSPQVLMNVRKKLVDLIDVKN